MKLKIGQRWLRCWDNEPPGYKIVEIVEVGGLYFKGMVVSTNDSGSFPIGYTTDFACFPEDNDESNYKNNIWEYLKGQDKPNDRSI